MIIVMIASGSWVIIDYNGFNIKSIVLKFSTCVHEKILSNQHQATLPAISTGK